MSFGQATLSTDLPTELLPEECYTNRNDGQSHGNSLSETRQRARSDQTPQWKPQSHAKVVGAESTLQIARPALAHLLNGLSTVCSHQKRRSRRRRTGVLVNGPQPNFQVRLKHPIAKLQYWFGGFQQTLLARGNILGE